MVGESLKSYKCITLSVLLLLSINVHADVLSCTVNTTLNTANIKLSTDEVQLKSEKITPKKTKSSSGYFGMFKLLIPDTLR